jgi:hypothetical protein
MAAAMTDLLFLRAEKVSHEHAAAMRRLRERSKYQAATLRQTARQMGEYNLSLTALFNTLERARMIRKRWTR